MRGFNIKKGKKYVFKESGESKRVVKTSTHVKTKLKIALVSTPMIPVPPPSYGGLEVVVADLGKYLARLGHDVTIFAPDGSKVEGCRVVETGKPQNPSVIGWRKLEIDMYECLESQLWDFDVIHAHNWFGSEYILKRRNPRLMKVIHTHHGGMLAGWWAGAKFKLNNVAISDWMKYVYEMQGIPTRRVYNGVDLERYPLQREKGDRFLWLSRISFFKAPHRVIGLARKLNFSVDIAGATCFPEDAKYIEQIKKSCDGKQVRFLGQVSNNEKVRLMQNAKGFLVTGKWGEPFGLHVIEAMATGTTVISMADGGIKETVKKGGVLCEDLYDFEDALYDYEPIPPEICRRNAGMFSAKRMATTYVKLYEDVLAGGEW